MCSFVLSSEDWVLRRSLHESRVAPWIEPHLARSSLGQRHPIYDFLFEYYSYRPAHLRRWHPGVGVALEGAEAHSFLLYPNYRSLADGVMVCPLSIKPERLTFPRWLHNFLESTQTRPPFYGCSGLHEWAMVYRTDEVRHPDWPLRLGHEETSKIVESLPIRCSHFDAFRFFTSAAAPLNRLRPTRELSDQFEQPGCLHANMDLYKWSYKLAPFTPSELVADAFALARDIREVDMRASPYDFSHLGFLPITIETTSGRAEYEVCQRDFFRRAQPIRQRLIETCRTLLDAMEPTGAAVTASAILPARAQASPWF